MRRKDREVNDPSQINEFIQSCQCLRLGLSAQEGVYIVPLNFAYVDRNGSQIFYFHGAKTGRKMELLKKSPLAGFELDGNHELKPGDTACSYSFGYTSVIGSGRAQVVEDMDEKREALGLIMAHCTGRGEWTFQDSQIEAVAVFKLEVAEMSCKANK